MAALDGEPEGTAVGVACPMVAAALGAAGAADCTAATASANGPPERYRIPGFFTSVISISSRTLGGRSAGSGRLSLMCFIAT